MKYIWFLYLKQCGYAFVDDPDNGTAAPMDSPAPVTPLPRPRKRPRHGGDDPLPNPKRPKVTEPGTISCSSEVERGAAAFDEFPGDDGLFECSQDSNECTKGDPLKASAGKRMTGNERYLFCRGRRQSTVRNFSVQYTIAMLYLGLQYTEQKILLSDLKR